MNKNENIKYQLKTLAAYSPDDLGCPEIEVIHDLQELTYRAAIQQFDTGFVTNLMTTGTKEYDAIQAGVKIGEKLRSKVLSVFSA